MVTVTELNRAPDGRFESFEATGTLNTADISAATDGQALTKAASGTDLKFASVSGKFETALSDGEVLADDGNLYTSVQTAENNATDYMFIGPGTFSENVTIDTAGISVLGSGRGTVIDGDDAPAITINAANITISNLAMQTTAGGGNSNAYCLLSDTSADEATLKQLFFLNSDRYGIRIIDGSGHLVSNCVVESCDNTSINLETDDSAITNCLLNKPQGDKGLDVDGSGCIISNNLVIDPGFQTGIDCGIGDNIISGNTVVDCGGNGIDCSADDSVIYGNRIMNSGDKGFILSGTDQIATSNRISGSTNSNLDTAGATTPTTDNNITGSAN